MIWLIFVLWHINHHGLFNAKVILVEEQQWYYLTNSWGDKEVHTFRRGINPEVNVFAQLEFDFAYYNATVQHFSHYAMGALPSHIENQSLFSSTF